MPWWTQSADSAPPNDPRILQTDTTLAVTNQVARQTLVYDQYNNKTDAYEHDYGAGAPGLLLRRTHSDYLTNGYDTNLNIHLRSLPLVETVYDGGGAQKAQTTYEYDNYTADGNHAPLLDRPGISGHDTAAFHTGYLTRGNVTAISRWLNTTGAAFTTYPRYDIAGNVVLRKDPRGFSTTFDYTDRFGSPDGEARANTPPVELAGQSSYAFPTLVSNALNHTSYTQYDYYLGKEVNSEDPNGTVSRISYNDLLDRPTQVARGAGSSAQNQTTFVYDDPNRMVRTTSDQNAYGDNRLKSELVYDGLGRQVEARRYESATGYITTLQNYDALGRVFQVSNPYRPASEGALWTTTQYDALGRVASVTTPDSATVSTVPSSTRRTARRACSWFHHP